MTIELDETSWPRIYSTTMAERLAMTPKEIEELWREYREFWREGTTTRLSSSEITKALDLEYSRDWLEDKDGTYR